MTTDSIPLVTSDKAVIKPKATITKPVAAKPKAEMATVTLDVLCKELELAPREARMMLRLAVKKKAEFPNLSKGHEPRAPWQWALGSKALEEARRALLNQTL
jgi:hypothetical protein